MSGYPFGSPACFALLAYASPGSNATHRQNSPPASSTDNRWVSMHLLNRCVTPVSMAWKSDLLM
jgi:hypothetical protein